MKFKVGDKVKLNTRISDRIFIILEIVQEYTPNLAVSKGEYKIRPLDGKTPDDYAHESQLTLAN